MSERNAVEVDLDSHDPTRIAGALRALREAAEYGDEFPIRRLEVRDLDAFGDDVPEDVQIDFLRVIDSYQSFEPPMTSSDRIATKADLVLRTGSSYLALEVALTLQGTAVPPAAVTECLRRIRQVGIDGPRALAGAEWLVSYLLDGKDPVRRTTIDALAEWPRTGAFREVVEYVRPQLSAQESSLLTAP